MKTRPNSTFSDIQLSDISRSRFPMSFQHITTMPVGKLVPLKWIEVVPHDTFKVDLEAFARAATPIHPVMGTAYLDVWAFFVPFRIVWSHYRQFLGENETGSWASETVYRIPQIVSPGSSDDKQPFSEYSVADYLGVPINYVSTASGEEGIESISVLPFRGYAKIWNYWFRRTAVDDPALVTLGDTDHVGAVIGGNPLSTAQNGGDLLPLSRFHDYFSSALPEPQFGTAPEVIPDAMVSVTADGQFALGNASQFKYIQMNSDGSLKLNSTSGITANTNLIYKAGLDTDINLTVNQLRLAFQTQKILELIAQGGSRYREIIYSMYGVAPRVEVLQEPELLGHIRTPLGMKQVLQTSETANTPLGNTGAYSATSTGGAFFEKSFDEPGMLMFFAGVRTVPFYSQGIEKKWTRKDRFEFYAPQFANLGNMPIYNYEIYASGTFDHPANGVFGYSEAWADYRYIPNSCAGSMRVDNSATLSSWHYGEDYSEIPYLGADWMHASSEPFNRTIAVPGRPNDAIIAQFAFNIDAIRPMPVYSIPGLVDHH